MNTNPAPRNFPSDYEIENAIVALVRGANARMSQPVARNMEQDAHDYLELSALILDNKATTEQIDEAFELIENNTMATDDDTFGLYLDISNMTTLDSEVVEFVALDSVRLHGTDNDATEILNNLINHFTDSTDDEVMNTVVSQLDMLQA